MQAKQLLADTLSPLLVPAGKPKGKLGREAFQGTHQSPPGLPRSNHMLQHSSQDAQSSPHNDEVPIDDQVCPKLIELSKRKIGQVLRSFETNCCNFLGASLTMEGLKRSYFMFCLIVCASLTVQHRWCSPMQRRSTTPSRLLSF